MLHAICYKLILAATPGSRAKSVTASLSLLPAVEPLTTKAADALRAAILSGRIQSGERLSVPEIARRLGISRTPAREALLLLERDGLVESRPRLGVVVISGNEKDLKQLFDLREMLDGMAARLAAETLDKAQRSRLSAILEQHESAVASQLVDRHIELDLEFHALLRDGSGNVYLAESLLKIERKIMLFMRAFSTEPKAMSPAVIREHRAVAKAVLAQDGVRAEETARAHVRSVSRFYQKSLATRAGTEESPP